MPDPTAMDLGDSWKPPALREAEAQLDQTMAKSNELIKQVEEKLKSMPDIDHKAKPEDVTAIKAAAAKPDAPAPLRALKKKVDAGELTWEDVLEGKALRDETVREVMAGRLAEMHEIYQEVEEGATLDDILEARGVSSGSVFNNGGGPASTYAQSTPDAPPSEDDYFGNSRLMSNPPAQQTPPPAPPAPAPPQPPAGPPQPPRSTPPPRTRGGYSDDEFDNPLTSRNRPQDQPNPPARAPRGRAEHADEEFDNPLASRDAPPEPPKPASPPRAKRRRGDDDGDEDDYFGGSILR